MKGRVILLALIAVGFILQIRTALMVQDFYERCEQQELSFLQALVVDNPYRHTASETVLRVFWKAPSECEAS